MGLGLLLAGFFIVLGLVFALLTPAQLAEIKFLRDPLDSHPEVTRQVLKQNHPVTRWTMRIVGSIFLLFGVVLLVVFTTL